MNKREEEFLFFFREAKKLANELCATCTIEKFPTRMPHVQVVEVKLADRKGEPLATVCFLHNFEEDIIYLSVVEQETEARLA